MSASAQILADLMIAGASFWTLRKQRGGYHATRTVVGRVIRFTLGTGLAPAVLGLCRLLVVRVIRSHRALADRPAQLVFSPSVAFTLFSLTLAKGPSALHPTCATLTQRTAVYSNCLLVSLNARKHFRDMLGDVHMSSLVVVHTSGGGGSTVAPRIGVQAGYDAKNTGLVMQ